MPISLKLLAGLESLLSVESEDDDIKSFHSASTAMIGNVFYDPEAKELQVTYATGDTYTYHGVSNQRYSAFNRALSRGGYLARRIKPSYTVSRGGI